MREEWAQKKENPSADASAVEDGGAEKDAEEGEEEPANIEGVADNEGEPAADGPLAVPAEEGAEESRQSKLATLLAEKLPESVNKQRADEFTTAFCFLNSKGARKKLVTALVRLPRNRSELAPTYARIIAS